MSAQERGGPMSREHAGLIRRVSSLIRPAIRGASAGTASPETPAASDREDLQARLDRVETLIEDLQDALYRQSQRHDAEIEALQRSVQPEELARSLSADARRRGL